MPGRIWLSSCLAFSIAGSFLYAEQCEKGQWDLLTEFVYMRRQGSKDHVLVLDSSVEKCRNGCSSSRVLDTGNLVNDFGFDPGFRVGLAFLPDIKSTYEANFLYIWEWEASETKRAEDHRGSLFFPFSDHSFTQDFFGADKAHAKYKSFFYTFELNYWRNFSRRQQDYFALSGIFGLRFAHLKEHFVLDFYDRRSHSDYTTSTQNDLIGVQAGGCFQINPNPRFNWDLLAKVGIGLNRAYDNVFLGDDDNTIVLRKFKKQDWQDVVFAEASTRFGYQVSCWANLHIGYQFLYFSGLALATDQLSHSTKIGNSYISTKGYIYVHGVFAGFTFTF